MRRGARSAHHEIQRASIERQCFVCCQRATCQEYDRNGNATALQLRQKLDPGRMRQMPVENDDVAFRKRVWGFQQ